MEELKLYDTFIEQEGVNDDAPTLHNGYCNRLQRPVVDEEGEAITCLECGVCGPLPFGEEE